MKSVLLVTICFSPNIGGIETHFDDLTLELDRRGWKVWVLTYKPITTPVSAPFFEKRWKGVFIYRIPWIRGWFYRLVDKPVLEFMFLTPGLFLGLPLILLTKAKKVSVIHSHGLVAGFVAVFWGKIFGKKVITTTHSIYNFPQKGLYRDFARWIFGSSDIVLCLSKQSKEEIESLGVNPKKVKTFTYWVDLEKFKRQSVFHPKGANVFHPKGEIALHLKGESGVKIKPSFVVLFVGRLVKEKGVLVLIKAAKKWNKNITLAIAGTGPLEEKIRDLKSEIPNLIYLGKIDNDKLPLYYSSCDLVIFPSIHEEGFGRVILESLACGTPVIGANRGAIPEAMDETVGKLIEVTPENIKMAVEYFYKNPDKLKKLAKNARPFAEEKYSEKNVEEIISAYEKE